MPKTVKHWKRGRGKLGVLAPLIGTWKAAAKSQIGSVKCTRTFAPVLNGAYIQLTYSEAIGFEAHMLAGLARMAYWPDEADGYYWVVESKNKKGWNRFTEHHYVPA